MVFGIKYPVQKTYTHTKTALTSLAASNCCHGAQRFRKDGSVARQVYCQNLPLSIFLPTVFVHFSPSLLWNKRTKKAKGHHLFSCIFFSSRVLARNEHSFPPLQLPFKLSQQQHEASPVRNSTTHPSAFEHFPVPSDLFMSEYKAIR